MNQLQDSSSLIQRLMLPASFDHAVQNIRLLETHISWVILTGQYAYKIKKPVDLGFLDFSTLEKRRFYCAEEIRLNRRLADDYYLGVVPVTGTREQPRWGGSGRAIEYAVKMREFPQDAQLDRVLARGQLAPRYMDAFAHLIADFHERAAVADTSGNYGAAKHIRRPLAGNFSQLGALVSDADLLKALDKLRHWSQKEFAAMEALFRQRKALGFVRECHGDMHLRNMAWIDNRPLIFDCIEFNPELRWIDVISEIAFLVMDLRHRRQAQLAWRFLNAYLEHSGDYAGMQVLPFYLTYRAMVRAKVAAIRASQDGISTKEKNKAEQALRAYLLLAEQCSQHGQPMLLITRGLSASGKSTLSSLLQEKLGAIRIRSDVERKRLFGVPGAEPAKTAFGEGIYSDKASKKTYARLVHLAETILASGFPVIVDAAFLKAEQRQPFRLLAARKRLPYVILQLKVPQDTLRKRIQSRQDDVSDADLKILEQQLRLWKELEAGEQQYAITINMDKELELARLLRQIQGKASC